MSWTDIHITASGELRGNENCLMTLMAISDSCRCGFRYSSTGKEMVIVFRRFLQEEWLVVFVTVNTSRPRQNGRHFADDTFKYIFLNENVIISPKISLNFVPKGPINNIPALVQIMAWRRPGDKPLSEPMMVRLPTHICVTRPQWVKRMAMECIYHLSTANSYVFMIH